MSNHNPLCQQAMDIDPEVPNCICDWVDAAERDTEARIIKMLEGDKRLHSYFYAEQFIKAGASVLPFVEIHAKDCPGCDLSARIKG